MRKDEYERVRTEIAKRYKNEISELKIINQKLEKMYKDEHNARVRAENELKAYKAELEALPNEAKAMMRIYNIFSKSY